MIHAFKSLIGASAIAVVATGAWAQQDNLDFYLVGGKGDDTYWAVVKKGFEDAGVMVEAQGGSVNYMALQTYDRLGADAADLTRTSIGLGADVLLVPDWVPEAQDGAIKAAVEQGAQVYLIGAGSKEKAEELGAINYIGIDDRESGVVAGEHFVELGGTNLICLNTLPGLANVEARCAGFLEGVENAGGSARTLPLPATAFGDPTAISEAVKSELLTNPDVDGIISVGANDAVAIAIGVQTAGAMDRVQVASFDLNSAVLTGIEDGSLVFAMDQQQYLMSYLGTALALSHVLYGTELPDKPLSTGPNIIDSSNLEVTMAGVEAGAR